MNCRPLFAALILTGLSGFALTGQAESETSKEVMREHRSEIQNELADIDYQRKRIVELNMNLTAEEANRFWPIYNIYRSESDKLSQQSIALLIDYASAYENDSIDNDQAGKMIERANSLMKQRQKLRERYVDRIAKEVSQIRAMRFLQIETQLDALGILDVGRQLPLAE